MAYYKFIRKIRFRSSLVEGAINLRLTFTSLIAAILYFSISMNSSVGITNVLANEDSVLQRNGIEDSVKGYEKLFDGARASIGKTSTDMSVEKRSKEYQTLVNSFYNLVTDFYQIGWGQVRSFINRSIRAKDILSFCLFFA